MKFALAMQSELCLVVIKFNQFPAFSLSSWNKNVPEKNWVYFKSAECTKPENLLAHNVENLI